MCRGATACGVRAPSSTSSYGRRKWRASRSSGTTGSGSAPPVGAVTLSHAHVAWCTIPSAGISLSTTNRWIRGCVSGAHVPHSLPTRPAGYLGRGSSQAQGADATGRICLAPCRSHAPSVDARAARSDSATAGPPPRARRRRAHALCEPFDVPSARTLAQPCGMRRVGGSRSVSRNALRGGSTYVCALAPRSHTMRASDSPSLVCRTCAQCVEPGSRSAASTHAASSFVQRSLDTHRVRA